MAINSFIARLIEVINAYISANYPNETRRMVEYVGKEGIITNYRANDGKLYAVTYHRDTKRYLFCGPLTEN